MTVTTPAGTSEESSGCQFVFSPLSVTTTSLPIAHTHIAYSQALEAAHGSAPYTWTLVGGSLPVGLELSSAGVISGTPRALGDVSFTVRATDSSSPTQYTATATLSINVGAGLAQGHPELFANNMSVGNEAEPLVQVIYGDFALQGSSVPGGEVECASLGWGGPLERRLTRARARTHTRLALRWSRTELRTRGTGL